jgi:hypothetical protein
MSSKKKTNSKSKLTQQAMSNKKKQPSSVKPKDIYKRYNTSSKKRRSEGLIFIEEIDFDKLDRMVNILFAKFIYHYEYEDTLNIPDIPEFMSSEFVKAAREESFVDKLLTYFKIYKIEQKNLTLVSNNEEGSYILRHAKIWIMFIQSLIDEKKIDFSQICEVFNTAINYDVDDFLLFDYFFVISNICDLKELETCNSQKIPKKFIEIYNDNREHIIKVLEEEEEDEKDVSFCPKGETADSSSTFNPFISSTNNIATTAVFNKIHTNRPLEEDNLDNSTEIDNDNDLSKYLIATPEVCNEIPIIYEEAKESDTEDNPTPLVRQKGIKKSTILYEDTSLGGRSPELIEVMIKEKNFNNSGNYAVLELSEKSRREEGFRFMITPLKPTHHLTESKKVQDEAKQILKQYSDVIYQPFDNNIYEMITKTDDSEIPTKRLSFSKLK